MFKLDCPPVVLFILIRNAACVHPVLKFKLFIQQHSHPLLMSITDVILGLTSYIFVQLECAQATCF